METSPSQQQVGAQHVHRQQHPPDGNEGLPEGQRPESDGPDESPPADNGNTFKTSIRQRLTKRYHTLKKVADSMLEDFSVTAYQQDVRSGRRNGRSLSPQELEAYYKNLTQPAFFVLFAPPVGDIRISSSDNWLMQDAAVKAARDYFISAVANSIERQRLKQLIPPADPSLSADAFVPVSNKRKRNDDSLPYSKEVRTALRDVHNTLLKHAEERWKANEELEQRESNCTMPISCPVEKAEVCRVEVSANGDKHYPCGGTCKQLRELMDWPDKVCLVDLHKKLPRLEIQEAILQALAQHSLHGSLVQLPVRREKQTKPRRARGVPAGGPPVLPDDAMDVAEHFTNLGLNSNRRPNLQPGTNAIPSQQGVNAAGGMGQEDVASGAERQDATRASTAQEVPAAATTGQGQQQSNLGTTTAGDADLGNNCSWVNGPVGCNMDSNPANNCSRCNTPVHHLCFLENVQGCGTSLTALCFGCAKEDPSLQLIGAEPYLPRGAFLDPGPPPRHKLKAVNPSQAHIKAVALLNPDVKAFKRGTMKDGNVVLKHGDQQYHVEAADLWRAINSYGGYYKVTNDRRWRQVGVKCGLPSDLPSDQYVKLKNRFKDYLLQMYGWCSSEELSIPPDGLEELLIKLLGERGPDGNGREHSALSTDVFEDLVMGPRGAYCTFGFDDINSDSHYNSADYDALRYMLENTVCLADDDARRGVDMLINRICS